MSSNNYKEQNQITLSCASRSTSQTSSNFQFQIIKLEDLNRYRNRDDLQNLEANVNTCLRHGQSGQVGINLPSRRITVTTPKENTLSNSSVIKYKSKPKCPMCHGSSAAYYCADCVRNGNFYHSSLKLPER